MKSASFILIFVFSLLYFATHQNVQQKEFWNHFWAIPEDQSLDENILTSRETLHNKAYAKTTSSRYSPNIRGIPIEEKQLKYKLQKKPFGGPLGEPKLELVIRH